MDVRTVAVLLEGPLAHEVATWAEAEAGWHVAALDGPPRPQLVLAGSVVPGRATVVLVDGPTTSEQVRAGMRDGALDVLSWPAQRDRLLELGYRGAEAPAAPARRRAGPRLLLVGGAGGGAGTSTVVLAMAGLLCWSGRRVLVLGGEDLLTLAGIGPWEGPGVGEVLQLDPAGAALEATALARAVPGVPGLAVLGTREERSSGAAAVTGAAGVAHLQELVRSWPTDVVLVDLRTTVTPADLVVARPDRCLRAVRGGAVVVVGRGPLSPGAARRLLGAEPLGWLDRSARVARAGLAGRVPSALPGSWLRDLRPLLGGLLGARGARP